MRTPSPYSGCSGNITPQSITIALPAHSSAIRLSPISPNPPSATILTGATVDVLSAITLPALPPHRLELYSVQDCVESWLTAPSGRASSPGKAARYGRFETRGGLVRIGGGL